MKNIVIILLCLNLIAGAEIASNIPNVLVTQNKSIIIFPYDMNKLSQEIKVNFELVKNSVKVMKTQVLGLKIEGNNFKNFSFSCQLNSVSKFNKHIEYYKMTSRQPIDEEEDIAYCELDDLEKDLLSNEDMIFTLTLNFMVKLNLSNNYQFNFFIASSYKSNRIIIGTSLLEYSPYTNDLKLLEIKNIKFFNFKRYAKDPDEIIVSQVHDVKFEIKQLENMNEEFFFLIRVVNNNNDYSITNEIYSKNINNSNLGIKDREGLNKLIAKSSYKTNKEIYIKFKSLNKGEMSLIIKNCFSNKVGEFWFEIFILDKYFKELSYLKSKLFKTVEGTIIIQQITQPDNFTLYQGSVWALNFDIKINMPGENDYLVIQHDNHKAMESKVNMIASTCDFTQKDDFNFKQEFGIRPICYPIQKDLNFSSNLGSGIFFKLGEYSNEAIIKLKIFVYAEFCGTTDTVCDIFDDQKCSSVKKFSFTASLYKVVSLNSEQKLQNRIATSVSKKIDQLCTNNYLYNTININDNTAYEPYEYFQKTIYNTHKNSIFYKEYTDFEFGVLKEDLYSSVPSINEYSFFADVSNLTRKKTETITETMDITKGNINDELIGNYFNFKMPVLYPENDENGKLHNVYGPVGAFALPFEEDINGSETQKFYKGRMYFSAGKSFVEKDLVNRCYLSWANYANNIINASDFNTLQIQALSDYYDKQDLTKNPSTKFSNLLYYNSDDSKSQIFWKEDLGHFISFEQDETTNKYLFLRHAYIKGNGSNPPETPHNGFFGLINTCMRFKEKKIISQYEYIDFNIYFDKDISINLLSKNYQINRFNRFFKFIYEIGISNSKFTEIEQIFNIHAVNLPISSDVLPQYDKNTVCLIEISNKIKDILVKDKANTLVIYLYKLGLLDIDESENSSSSYPFYPGNFNFNTRFSTIESNFYQKENDYFKHSKAISHPSGFITSGVIIDGKIKHNYDLSRFFITTFVDSQIIYPRTTPHQFLENSIIIKDLMPLLMKSNILLPINCPIMNTFKNDGGRQATIYNPSITIATTKGNSYSNISTSLNFITKKIDANKVPISTWGFDLDFLEKILHISTLKGIDSLSEVPIYTTLKFESYVSKIDNLLYVSPWIGTQYNSGNPGANPKYKFNCSAFIFFLNIDTQKNLTLDLRSTKIKGEILDSNFYLDKKNLKK